MSHDSYSSSDDEVIMTDLFEIDKKKDIKKIPAKKNDAIKTFLINCFFGFVNFCSLCIFGLLYLPIVVFFCLFMLGIVVGMVHPFIMAEKMDPYSPCIIKTNYICIISDFYYDRGIDLQCLILIVNLLSIFQNKDNLLIGWKMICYIATNIFLLWLSDTSLSWMLPTIILIVLVVCVHAKQIFILAKNEIENTKITTKEYLLQSSENQTGQITFGVGMILLYLPMVLLFFFFLYGFIHLTIRLHEYEKPIKYNHCDGFGKFITFFCLLQNFYLKYCIDLQILLFCLNVVVGPFADLEPLFSQKVQNKYIYINLSICCFIAYIITNIYALKYIDSPFWAIIPVVSMIFVNVFLYISNILEFAKIEINKLESGSNLV